MESPSTKTDLAWEASENPFAPYNELNYTPVIKHSNGKSPFSIGNTSSKGSFSIAMLDYQRVGGGFKHFLCSPLPGEMIQFDEHIFQMGWFNHQLDKIPPGKKHVPRKGTVLIGNFIFKPSGDMFVVGRVARKITGCYERERCGATGVI